VTYSIVARDPVSGALGVGVQTHQPAVGAIVPWVKEGVGAVATQAFANRALAPQALALMEHGLDAPAALAGVLSADSGASLRQVGAIDAHGRVAVHTGDQCIPHAGHEAGEGFTVQANMMARETVPAAMAAAYESASGPLAIRILAALTAAEGEGGDIRGRQSAAILVRGERGPAYLWDLRVDDDPEPLDRLARLVNIRLASSRLQGAQERLVAGPHDAGALAALEQAFAECQALAPSDEQAFWYAVTGLLPAGATDHAVAVLDPLFARAPQWRELLLRLQDDRLVPLRSRYAR
jgi:uncharacterized Ntn-hydrolase superfamily protein